MMMRSVMSSIHRQGDGEGNNQRWGQGERIRFPRQRKDGDSGAAPPPLIPIAASYNNGEYNNKYSNNDDEYDNDVFPDDDLYRQRCRARRPASLVYTTSSCLPYGSEVWVCASRTRAC